MPANLENLSVGTSLENVSFHSNPSKSNDKENSHHRTIALILHASPVMLKIIQAGFLQYVNQELPDILAGFEKAEEQESKLPKSFVS